jgi:hypothetical protein
MEIANHINKEERTQRQEERDDMLGCWEEKIILKEWR